MDRKTDVLAMLKARGSGSLTDIARQLGVSKQGALRHLEALQAKGLVEVSTETHRGPGRPGHVYRLTPAAREHFPSSHRELAVELVEFMEASEVERFFAERAGRMEAQHSASLAGLDLEKRTRQLGQLAREQGHMTEVTERPDGRLELQHRNCPIQDVAARTGYPCQHELELYRRVLKADVVRSSWVGAGDASCTYEITEHEGKSIPPTPTLPRQRGGSWRKKIG
jgi:predicted ArsR family transcriptional regulator